LRRLHTVVRLRGLTRRERVRACHLLSPTVSSRSSSPSSSSTKARIAASAASARRARVGVIQEANMCSYTR
jgi:hypothetical protein